MKTNRILLAFALSTFGMVSTAIPAEANNNSCVPMAISISVEGEVQYERLAQERLVAPLRPSAQLCQGDLISVGANSRARLQCHANGETVRLSARMSRSINQLCPPPADGERIGDDNEPIIVPRGGNRKVFILSPRSSIRSRRPQLRWQAVPDAAHYTIWLSGYQLQWTSDPLEATELDYPDDLPPLQYGNTYTLKAIARDENGEIIASDRVRFPLLYADQIEAVRQREEAIEQNYTGTERDILLGALYSDRDLSAEAIAIWERAIEADPDNANIALRLGQLYFDLKRYDLAVNWIQRAFNLAVASDDGVVLDSANSWLTQYINVLPDLQDRRVRSPAPSR